MGYSNNKWRKLLTILMIINLCFILFAKITKSLGAFSVTYEEFEIPINDSLINNNPYYAIFVTEDRFQGNPYFCLFTSNSPLMVRLTTSGATRLYAYNINENGIDLYATSGMGFINHLRDTTFSSPPYNVREVSVPGIPSNWTCVYTNHDIKNYENPNEILFPDNSFFAPHFDNITEIENGYPDGVFISRNSYSENEALYFHLLKITDTVADGNQSVYYYEPKVFKLIKDNKYYRTYPNDTENKFSYYYIQRSALTLDTNSSYLYVLSNNGDFITNSYGILQPDIPGGIYDVVESDTAGIITQQDAINDKIANINNNQQDIANSQQDIANNSNNITNFLTENTISNDTNNNIDTNLDFNNQNTALNNLNGGFFSRLTLMLTNLLGYNLAEDTSVSIPLPNSYKSIVLHSIDIYNNVTGSLRLIINAFWVYIFSFYMWKFINKIYIAVSTGNILDSFSSSGEAITNDML